MKKILLGVVCLWLACLTWAQDEALPFRLPQAHPRYLTTPDRKPDLLRTIATEPWAADVFDRLKRRVDTYVARTDTQPDWLLSRLAMNWTTHATEVYVRGEVFDHAGGQPAPVPTVRFTGTRGTVSTHARPSLEDVVPYDDDDQGRVCFHNKTLPGQPMERVHPSKTGRHIESLNREIMGIARDAAFLHWLTDDVRYARLAAGVFDTYMTGIYYRQVPVDLNHGHQQTLLGLTSFEVIHEDILYELVPLYDFLHPYLSRHYAGKMTVYADAFRKWADNIIDNGVPHNNWNLMQARYVMDIALMLDDDTCYADGKGRGYYMDRVLHRSSLRQWSLKQLADYGYDPATGIWAECPGYSQVVLGDFTSFLSLFDRTLHADLTRELPVLLKAADALPQYLFPNRMICGFGDTHPGPLDTRPWQRIIRHAQTHGKKDVEARFTAMLKCFAPDAAASPAPSSRAKATVSAFFDDRPLQLDARVAPGQAADYVSPVFHAPNVSWLVQRNGMDPRHSLMASLNGSLGNHMHANGISMELYGKGYVLGPDAGIGQSLYSGLDYAEYYSQFPSHNTVCVDGISSYPVMKSHHGFRLLSAFPAPSGPGKPFLPVTYSHLAFLEPETQADQTRLTGIVTVGPQGGYYVDIFRSRKQQGGDKMHDYFYHNLGQTLTLSAADGAPLPLQPTADLAFAGGHLYAYSYFYDQQAATTGRDVRADFLMQMPDSDHIRMTLWMKGEPRRTLFTALAPPTEGYSRIPGMPYDLKHSPTLTFVARQEGEAWTRPFVAVYEPSSVSEPPSIRKVSYPPVQSSAPDGSAVGLRVDLIDGRTDRILSSADASLPCRMGRMEAAATYALWIERQGADSLLFLGHGTRLQTPSVCIEASSAADVLLQRLPDGRWQYAASAPFTLRMGGQTRRLAATGGFLRPL